MDKAIDAEVLSRKKKKITWLISTALIVLVISLWGMRTLITPAIANTAFTKAIIEKGDVENTITASGEILPEFEETITSPINASIMDVMIDAGRAIKKGESVLNLDKSSSQIEFEKLQFQLESKRNDIRKLKLNLDKSFYDIRSNNDIKQLRINSLEAAVENARRLFKAGGGIRESIDIPLLVNFFISTMKEIYNRPNLSVSREAMKWLKQLPWPGNIRQLKNLVERSVLMSRNDHLEMKDLLWQPELSPAQKGQVNLPQVGTLTLEEIEVLMIKKALDFHKNKISKAAESLGLTRSSLYRRLDKFNIPYDETSD